jgi:hypothetical protein
MKILADSLVEQVNLGQRSPPIDWVSRLLYAGDDQARSFLEASREPSYNAPGLHELCRAAVSPLRAKTVLSFGPGDGRFDAELVQILNKLEPELNYIPVDISLVLLEAAAASVGQVAPVSVGLLVDIENGEAFLREAIDRHASRPALFWMLGGTIANLDSGETRFFTMLRDLMNGSDSFLVDLPLYGPAWRPDHDLRLKSRDYPRSFKRFLASGLIARDPSLAREDVADWFDDRVECVTSPGVVIERSKLFEVVERRTRRKLVSTHLYEWDSVQTWLRKAGFHISWAQSTLSSVDDELGMGVVVISRR